MLIGAFHGPTAILSRACRVTQQPSSPSSWFSRRRPQILLRQWQQGGRSQPLLLLRTNVSLSLPSSHFNRATRTVNKQWTKQNWNNNRHSRNTTNKQRHYYFSTRAPLSRGGGGGQQQQQSSTIPMYVWVAMATPVLGGTYFYYKYLDQAPLTHRTRWIATTPEWERHLGDEQYQQLVQQFRHCILPPTHRASVTVRRVGGRIATSAATFAKEHGLSFYNPNDKVTFTVVDSPMANAFVLPGNHIFVMTGLFQFVRDEDDLAAVLGHEMAHTLARHVGEKVSGSIAVQLLARFSLLWDPSGVSAMIFLPTAQLVQELPHSRTQELEADQIGMHLAAQACYDPSAAKRVFRRMEEATYDESSRQEKKIRGWFSTHPSHDERIKKLNDWLPETNRIFHRNDDVDCRQLREDMALARRIAAQRAAQLEGP